MGRKNKTYHKDLKQQVNDRLVEMLQSGEGTSKREAFAEGTAKAKIFSYNSYHTYRKHCYYFINYLKEAHPECTTLKKARKYAYEWLQMRENHVNDKGEHLSAWTIQTEAKSINKLFSITPEDSDYFEPPKRNRKDIKRSRGHVVSDRNFSERNNEEFVLFCRGTGCRRNIMEKLLGRDIWSREDMMRFISEIENKEDPTDEDREIQSCAEEALGIFDQNYFIHHRTDKGGRSRFAPIVGENKASIIRRMQNTGKDSKVWMVVPKNADIHSYRAEYATTIYKMYARPIEEIEYDSINQGTGRKYKSEVYYCKKDEAGKKLDKKAMRITSKAMGHNRLDIVANNYLRGL